VARHPSTAVLTPQTQTRSSPVNYLPSRRDQRAVCLFEEMNMPQDIKCVFGVDIDAVGGWLGSYGGEDSPSDIQRGMFPGEVGTPRLVNLFKKRNVPATWFIPGHSIETFPDSIKMIVDAGHEIGAHGYSHENPIAMTPVTFFVALEEAWLRVIADRGWAQYLC